MVSVPASYIEMEAVECMPGRGTDYIIYGRRRETKMRGKMGYPRSVRVETQPGSWLVLEEADRRWSCKEKGISVELAGTEEEFQVILSSPTEAVSHVQLSWENTFPAEALYLGDAFERGYGTLRFEPLNPEAVYHWYFMASGQGTDVCCGVRTQPDALCAWTVNCHGVDLWMDVRNGTLPLALGERKLTAATVVLRAYEGDSFENLRLFCKAMSSKDCTFTEPVIGGNDWYYAYGNNSRELILRNCRFLAKMCEDIPIRPWMVIDDGWQRTQGGYNGGPWREGNEKFGSMKEVAEEMKRAGVRPGIWMRPLLTREASMEPFALRKNGEGLFLDISRGEVLELVRTDIERIVGWGFEMIKHDFSTIDIFGRWGFGMGLGYSAGQLEFHDRTKTTAELIKQFYGVIREAAGSAAIIGCNTISHLSAGVFELMRTGDDTSGQQFQRTRKMGVNTMAFRIAQHNIFYQADADCLGISDRIAWEQNKKWLKLLSESGTPLFISCDPDLLTEEMRTDIKEAIGTAAGITEPAAPLDWKHNPCPEHWKTQNGELELAWYQTPRDYYEG